MSGKEDDSKTVKPEVDEKEAKIKMESPTTQGENSGATASTENSDDKGTPPGETGDTEASKDEDTPQGATAATEAGMDEGTTRQVRNPDEIKRSLSALLGSITKKRNEIAGLMDRDDNLNKVKSALHELEERCNNYTRCHEEYCTSLRDEEQREEQEEKFSQKRLSFSQFIRNVNVWIRQAEDEIADELGSAGMLSHQSHRSRRSKKSRSSQGSHNSARSQAIEKAKVAELMVEKAMLSKIQNIQAQQQSLELDMKLEKARAREKAFAQSTLDANAPEFNPRLTRRETGIRNVENPVISTSVPPASTPPVVTPPPASTPPVVNTPQLRDPLAPLPVTGYIEQNGLLAALTLPPREIPKFEGSITDYRTFITAFDARVTAKVTDDSDRLDYLQQHLTGDAHDLISGCLHMPAEEGYAEARRLLDKEYGDPYKLSTVYINKIQGWPEMKADESVNLKKFAMFLVKCKVTMKSVSYMSVLNHPPHMISIVGKLPVYLQHKWREVASKARLQQKKVMEFEDLVEFITVAAEAANDPVYGVTKTSTQNKNRSGTGSSSSSHHQTLSLLTSTSAVEPCKLCSGQHDLEACEEFMSKTIDDKRTFIRDNRLCFGCLGVNHLSKGCRSRRRCSICQKNHPTSLHIEGFQLQRTVTENTQPKERVDSSSCTATDTQSASILHAILPVRISQAGNPSSVITYAFFDDGSSGCFITDELQEALQATGIPTVLQLKTMHGCNQSASKVISNLVVKDLDGQNQVTLPRTYTREEIPASHNQIPKPEMVRQIHHLQHIADKIPDYNPELSIGLLIGSNCPAALEPLEVRPGGNCGPYAVRLRHGWTVHGPVNSVQISPCVTANRIVVKEVEAFRELMTPSSILNMFERDFVEHKMALYPNHRGMSFEDRKFLKMAQEGTTYHDGHYTIPLPFRDRTWMPNNKKQAERRIMHQRNKMLKDPQYYSDYKDFMEQLFKMGHAEKAPMYTESHEGSVWYLPHHGVYNVNKPGKIRIVFDCSANFMGTSLNSCLLQGPDLTNSLVGVLTRFREEKISFMGDIEKMFYQVRVPPEQRSFLRFLWWPGGDLDQDLQDYQMTVHLFGAISSPSIANFALKEAAKTSTDLRVKETIERNFYVDDCLKSVESLSVASDLIGKLCETCSNGGFRLTKFASNNPLTLQDIPDEDQAKGSKKCDLDSDESFTKALGMQWDFKSDQFGFSIVIKEKPFTRRGILSVISSVFDPLGFLAPVTLPIKRFLRDSCKDNELGWDDMIPDGQLQRYKEWLSSLSRLKDLKINRCFTTGNSNKVISKELHAFADGSSYAYGAAVYRRTVYEDGNCDVNLVIGKARLAPTKTMTVPKLELTAATTAVRLAQMIKLETTDPVEVKYYTDSATVLKYIASESGRWPVFVANRVQIIRDFSEPTQWNYIPSELNPADDASRGLQVSELIEQHRWLSGPQFLHDTENRHDPTSPCISTAEDTDIVNAVVADEQPTQYLINYFSSWYRLKFAVAVFLQVRTILQDRLHNSTPQNQPKSYKLQASNLHEAELRILEWLHRTSYPKEFEQLSAANPSGKEAKRSREATVLKSSALSSLDPFLLNNILRVGGRLRHTNLPETTKHPVILPRKSHITSLIIQHVHQSLGHAGRNHVLSELRQHYWVIGATSAVRNIIYHCIVCRRLRGPLQEQKMSDLPPCRTEDTAPPFTCTGVDYFGPFVIRDRRTDRKYYGVLFTCLASRAIHLEVAESLDTDSFLHALRRFIARRGNIRELYSDNGTNFVGAEKELQKAIKEMNQSQIEKKLRQLDINWKFNPPTASNMGGAWERLVRTVRKVLSGLLQEHGTQLDRESFHTLICEVEAIVNSRPLTSFSGDTKDSEPLTPSHILTGRTRVIAPPPGIFDRNDLYVRRRWRRVQYLANLFWSRWKNEFLLLQQQRQKWERPQRNMCQGDVVLIKDETGPRNTWPLGLVTSTETDKVGLVRVVMVKTQTSNMRRPINKLVLLVPNDNAN